MPNGIFCVVASGLPAERAESLRDLPCADVWAPITAQALAVLFVVDADARPVSGSGSGQEDPSAARAGPVDPSAARWHQVWAVVTLPRALPHYRIAAV